MEKDGGQKYCSVSSQDLFFEVLLSEVQTIFAFWLAEGYAFQGIAEETSRSLRCGLPVFAFRVRV